MLYKQPITERGKPRGRVRVRVRNRAEMEKGRFSLLLVLFFAGINRKKGGLLMSSYETVLSVLSFTKSSLATGSQ